MGDIQTDHEPDAGEMCEHAPIGRKGFIRQPVSTTVKNEFHYIFPGGGEGGKGESVPQIGIPSVGREELGSAPCVVSSLHEHARADQERS